MKTLILATLLLLISSGCFAQSDTIFFNAKWENCQRATATFYRLIIKRNKVSYLVTDYYISTHKPQMVAQCLSINPEEKNGTCTYYRENGMKESEGTYKNNKETGRWTWWDEDGKDSSIAEYQPDGTKNWIRQKNETTKNSNVFLTVEQMPEFPGGENALYQFLSKNIRYPSEAREKGIEGKVILQFVVNEDGSISDVKTIRELAGGCTEEAVRVLKAMPKWNPGKQNGRFVRVQMVLTVVFMLDNGGGKIADDNDKSTVDDKQNTSIIQPVFPWGNDALKEFLRINMKYPKEARKEKIEGEVIVQFIVKRDGSITGIQVAKDIGAGCGQEVIRVVKKMPNWLPGGKNGVTEDMQVTLPVIFKLNDKDKNTKK